MLDQFIGVERVFLFARVRDREFGKSSKLVKWMEGFERGILGAALKGVLFFPL